MPYILILVEGQTEEEFVGLLNEYLNPKQIYLKAVLPKTSNPPNRSAFRGGIVSYGKAMADIQKLLGDKSYDLVTTMIDFYGLPSDFPNYDEKDAKIGTVYQRVEYLEKKFAANINHPKFLPYLSVHEFEALLFSKPEEIVKQVRGTDDKAQEKLGQIRNRYPSPEEINLDDPPSKRILEELVEYDKVTHGFSIAIEIGIDAMRQECPHFDAWLKKLEALSSPKT